jgi:hypothetical protein
VDWLAIERSRVRVIENEGREMASETDPESDWHPHIRQTLRRGLGSLQDTYRILGENQAINRGEDPAKRKPKRASALSTLMGNAKEAFDQQNEKAERERGERKTYNVWSARQAMDQHELGPRQHDDTSDADAGQKPDQDSRG